MNGRRGTTTGVLTDRMVRVAVACVALAAVSCGGAEVAALTPTALEADDADRPMAVSTCDDDLGDGVVFDDGAPTTQPADAGRPFLIERIGLESDGETFTVWLSPRGEYDDDPPPSDGLLELHLQSVDDPAWTGSVRIGFRPDRGPDAWNVLASARGGPMIEVGIVDERIWRGRSAGGGGEVSIAADWLPVSPPFRWYVISRNADESDAGDVCPNVTGFTGDQPLPVFLLDADTT